MRLLRISIYVLIVLAIAKFTGGNKPQMQEEIAYSNTFSYKAAPHFEQQRLREEVMQNDSVTYLNFYSNLPLNHKPMFLKSNEESSGMYTRIYLLNAQQNRKSETNSSFIVF